MAACRWLWFLLLIALVSCGADLGGYLPGSDDDEVPPAEVSDLHGVVGDRTVVLSWSVPDDPDRANVIVSWSPKDGTQPSPRKLPPGTTAATLRDLVPGAEYTFTVRTSDSAGNRSEGVTLVLVAVASDTVPPEPVGNLVVERAPGNASAAMATWAAPLDHDLAGFEVSWSPNGPESPVVLSADRTSYPFAVQWLSTYELRITPIDAWGNRGPETVATYAFDTIDLDFDDQSSVNWDFCGTTAEYTDDWVQYQPQVVPVLGVYAFQASMVGKSHPNSQFGIATHFKLGVGGDFSRVRLRARIAITSGMFTSNTSFFHFNLADETNGSGTISFYPGASGAIAETWKWFAFDMAQNPDSVNLANLSSNADFRVYFRGIGGKYEGPFSIDRLQVVGPDVDWPTTPSR